MRFHVCRSITGKKCFCLGFRARASASYRVITRYNAIGMTRVTIVVVKGAGQRRIGRKSRCG
jgi:hypothetical protein